MDHLGAVRVGIQHVHRQLAHSHPHPLADDLPLAIDAAAELGLDALDQVVGDFILAFVIKGAGERVGGGSLKHLVLDLYDIGHMVHVESSRARPPPGHPYRSCLLQ